MGPFLNSLITVLFFPGALLLTAAEPLRTGAIS